MLAAWPGACHANPGPPGDLLARPTRTKETPSAAQEPPNVDEDNRGDENDEPDEDNEDNEYET